jgi:hypothetical protein
LPPDAATNTPEGSWPLSVELLAIIAEISHAHYRAFLQANGARTGQLPKQLRIPRPRDLAPRRRISTAAEVRDVIERAWGGGSGG